MDMALKPKMDVRGSINDKVKFQWVHRLNLKWPKPYALCLGLWSTKQCVANQTARSRNFKLPGKAVDFGLVSSIFEAVKMLAWSLLANLRVNEISRKSIKTRGVVRRR